MNQKQRRQTECKIVEKKRANNLRYFPSKLYLTVLFSSFVLLLRHSILFASSLKLLSLVSACTEGYIASVYTKHAKDLRCHSCAINFPVSALFGTILFYIWVFSPKNIMTDHKSATTTIVVDEEKVLTRRDKHTHYGTLCNTWKNSQHWTHSLNHSQAKSLKKIF